MKRLPLIVVGLSIVARAAVGETPAIDAASFLSHIKFLASDELQGRGNASKGLERAAAYIARRFGDDRLEPAGDTATFYQSFSIPAGVGTDGANVLTLTSAPTTSTFQIGVDYVPLSMSRSGARPDAAALPLVFAGYGISAPALGYDDYTGLDASGKAALILTDEPQEDNAQSIFEGKANTVHATITQKAMVARAHNVHLLIVVSDPHHPEAPSTFGRWLKDPQAEEYGIQVVRVSREALRATLGASFDLDATTRLIDEDLKPRSRELPGLSAAYQEHLTKVRRRVKNVIGILPGADPERSREAIVIGAHYDHLGLGGRDSLRPEELGQIHNGADDNASGTSAILEIARVAARTRKDFPRTLVFAAFAGEEIGLLGSAYYVDHPSVSLDRTFAMINLDMIGRTKGRLLVSGTDTAPSLQADLDAAANGRDLDIRSFREGSGVGSSDDTSFVLRQVPSIGFFSGFHADYHRPTDDWDKIDAEGGAAVTRLALDLVRRIANRREPISFVPSPSETNPHASPAPSSGGSSGYGPYFGSVPDFADDQEGVRFADVREGSPASKAGLERGDVLVSFAGTSIKTLYDFTFALRQKRPGDRVDVIVMREGREVRATVELGNRP